MAFELTRPSRLSAPFEAPVKIAVRNNSNGHCMVITLGLEMLAQLGIQPDEPIEILRGTGPDAGWLCLRPGSQGIKPAPPYAGKKNRVLLQIRSIKGLPNTFPAAAVDFLPDAGGKALRIKLPFTLKVA